MKFEKLIEGFTLFHNKITGILRFVETFQKKNMILTHFYNTLVKIFTSLIRKLNIYLLFKICVWSVFLFFFCKYIYLSVLSLYSLKNANNDKNIVIFPAWNFKLIVYKPMMRFQFRKHIIIPTQDILLNCHAKKN